MSADVWALAHAAQRELCAWCGTTVGSRYHEVCCERVGALPLTVTCRCYCHAEGCDGILCLDCRHVHGVPSWHCAGCHKRITDPLDVVACNDDGREYDLCGACYELPVWPVSS